jgi:ribonuclease D
LCIELSKEEQTSDWGAPTLTQQQCNYALKDVIYLHPIQERLDTMLAREGRTALAQACFDFIPHRAALDRLVHDGFDIFSHDA